MRIRRRIASPAAVAAVALSGGAGPAHAFDVPDHANLTRRAVQEELAAYPELGDHAAELVAGAVWEDLDVVVKWGAYNHYYKPVGEMGPHRRRTSDERVALLWEQAEDAASRGDLVEAWRRVGHLVHHVQDMASPPHVVPIQHGPTDGFETYAMDALIAGATGDGVRTLPAEDAHHALALRTWEAVHGETATVCGEQLPWAAYWSRSARAFGSYGHAGNRFGESACGDGSAFEAFAAARVDDAVGYSRAVLRWAAPRLDRLATRSARPVVARTWTPWAALTSWWTRIVRVRAPAPRA